MANIIDKEHEKKADSNDIVINGRNLVKVPDIYFKLSMSELRLYTVFLRNLVLCSLSKVGVCVLEDFLPIVLAQEVRKEVECLCESETTTNHSHSHRGDEIAWVSKEDSNKASIHELNKSLQNLVVSTGKQSKKYHITHKSHSQVSRFKNGKPGYKPHIDNPNGNGRLLSVAYYTNENYAREDGGLVRFYLYDSTKFIEVEPKFNVAVIYWSDRRVVKEVLPPNNRDLYHVTSWFFGSRTVTKPK